jgi:hypothetical protein
MARKTGTKKMAEKLSDIDVGGLRERIATKAYELYQQHGGNHGHDLDHWLTAEQLVQEEFANSNPKPEPRQKRTQKARKKA